MDCSADTALSLLTLKRTHTWLGHITTGDEKWISYSNIHRRTQWVDKGTYAEDAPKLNVHAKKVMLCIWWNKHGVKYWELLPQGCTVTADVYTEQLNNLKTNLEKTCPQQREVYFQHDNARPHIARTTKATDETRLGHFNTPTVFPRSDSLGLPLFSLSPASRSWSRLPNPRRHQKGTRAVLQEAVPSVLEQGHLRSA
ncbi:hypothetical protein RB195_006368 [Necator americanus]|uniref:Transposase n=1 Tax=Necator americanus TaxID=51031 RepID=A0ABR1BSA9_NECAM